MNPAETTLKFSKLDKRHTGHRWFSHRVSFIGNLPGKAVNLCNARDWLWATFGPSREVKSVGFLMKEPPQWAWETDYGYYRLYLTDQALTQFLLLKEKFEKDYSF